MVRMCKCIEQVETVPAGTRVFGGGVEAEQNAQVGSYCPLRRAVCRPFMSNQSIKHTNRES